MKKETIQLVKDFLDLQHAYQFTRRSMMTKERFKDVAGADVSRGLDIEDFVLTEPLIEHVGHLPIIASYFHSHIEHSEKVNLGRVLIMLSIHDIGETKVGDTFTFIKSELDASKEVEASRSLLSEELLPYFDEFEKHESWDAKYANSVDKLATVLHATDLIGFIYERFHKLGGTLENINTYNRSYMMWDSVLHDVFEVCYEQARRYEAGEELVFELHEYDLPRKV